MEKILIALLIGVVAGIVDVIPMLIMKLDRFSCLSAFFHWVVLGILIPFVNWDVEVWLKGLIIGLLSAIPVILMIWTTEKKSTIPILLSSAVLGVAVGLAGNYFIG